MSYTIKILRMSDISKETWNKFLKINNKQSTVFHTQEWMETLQSAYGYEPKYLAAINGDGSFAAVMPFMIDKRFGIRNYFSMPFDTYGGVLGDVTLLFELIDKFMKLPGIGMRYYVDYKKLDQIGNGFIQTKVFTYIIDISKSLDDILKCMDKRNQKVVMSLLKDTKISCSVAKTQEELQIIKDLFQPNDEIHGGGIEPELMDAIYTYMVPSGYCKPYLTKVNDIPVCASLFFIYNDTAMYWMMALTNHGRETHAHYKLMWQSIYDFKLMGIKSVNMGATPSVTDTVTPWKQSWGSKRELYYIYKRIPILLKPILRIKDLLDCYGR